MAKQSKSVIGRIWDALGFKDEHHHRTYVKKPTSKPAVEILEDRAVPTGNFGTIHGWTFIDVNRNGVLNLKEPGIPGVKVTLIGTDLDTPGDTITTGNSTISVVAVTRSNGSFTFTNVPEGHYKLQTNKVPGLIQGGSQTFAGLTIDSNGQVVRHDFAFKSGLSSGSLSLRQFVTNRTIAAYPYAKVGKGTNIADHIPTAIRPAPLTIATTAANSVIDLSKHFKDADTTNSQITFNITNGTVTSQIKMTLFDTMTPQTVTNFFNYIDSGDFTNTIFHRLTTIANSGLGILQGGALKMTDDAGTDLADVTVGPAIKNEFLAANSNKAGTIAMAQSGGNRDSATNQFFFNIVNNAGSLDSQRFTVFGKVTDVASQTVLTTLGATPTKDVSGGAFGAAHGSALLNNIPLTFPTPPGYTGNNGTFPTDVAAENYMRITSIVVNKRTEILSYSIVGVNGGGNAAVATITIDDNFITVHPVAAGGTTFTLKATDRFGASVTTTLDVNVTGNHAPVASSGIAITDQNTPFDGTLVATDVDAGDTLVFTIETPPAAGKGAVVITNSATGAYTFNPGNDFQHLNEGQPESFTFKFKATDNHGASSEIQTITITVNGLNDVPVANDGTATTDEHSTVDGILTASDVDSGDVFTFSVTQPAKGSVVLTNASTGAYTFDPGTDFDDVGEGHAITTSFTFKATDSRGGDSIGKTITITVNGINDLPVANGGAITTDLDTPVDGFLTASDPDLGDTVTYTLLSQPVKGSVLLTDATTGAFTFDPGSDFASLLPGQSEDVTFFFNAVDNHGAISAAKTITVTVTGNHVPVASNGIATTDEDNPVSGTLVATDADLGDTLTFSVVTQPAKGSVLITDASTGAYTFDPGLDFQSLAEGQSEDVTFTFQATDNHGATSIIKTITVTVDGVNDLPIANNGVLDADAADPVTGVLTATDPDVGDTIASYAIVSQPLKGSVVFIDATAGTYTFDPGTDFADLTSGQTEDVTFQFVAVDNHGAISAAATITVTVTG